MRVHRFQIGTASALVSLIALGTAVTCLADEPTQNVTVGVLGTTKDNAS